MIDLIWKWRVGMKNVLNRKFGGFWKTVFLGLAEAGITILSIPVMIVFIIIFGFLLVRDGVKGKEWTVLFNVINFALACIVAWQLYKIQSGFNAISPTYEYVQEYINLFR